VDLDEAADELYGLPPEEFTAARKERETAARRGGDRDLAREIGALGKPSTAAWVCNLLARRQPGEVDGLLELGGLLREAQEGLAGDQLRALDVQRRKLLAALVRQARGLAAEEGHRVSEAVATQVEETLRAALADPDAGEALRAGRLTSALSYSGLGTGARPDLRVVPPRPAPAPPRRAGASRDAGGQRRAEQDRAEERRRAEDERRQRELADARRAAQEAAEAAEEAGSAAREEEQRATELARAQDERQQRLDALAAELDRLRAEVTRGESDLDRAQRRAHSAAGRATEAAAARDRAAARLAELGG
jgi:DNA repair exonuclease SbcCD ATPase subunit